jgi:hypothetical protein
MSTPKTKAATTTSSAISTPTATSSQPQQPPSSSSSSSPSPSSDNKAGVATWLTASPTTSTGDDDEGEIVTMVHQFGSMGGRVARVCYVTIRFVIKSFALHDMRGLYGLDNDYSQQVHCSQRYPRSWPVNLYCFQCRYIILIMSCHCMSINVFGTS